MSNQETRQVTIIGNHINDNRRFESAAETFGELKQEQQAQGMFNGNIRVIIRETRNELTMENSKLPSGGFTLIVVADKVKSGSDKYDEMDYHELRRECIVRGFDSDKYNGAGVTSNVMRAYLRDDDLNNAPSDEEEPTVVETASPLDADGDDEYEEFEDEEEDEDDYEEDEDEEEDEEPVAPSPEVSSRFEEMKSRIEASVSKCKAEVTGILEEYVDILPDDVIPDYSDTVQKIKEELGLL